MVTLCNWAFLGVAKPRITFFSFLMEADLVECIEDFILSYLAHCTQGADAPFLQYSSKAKWDEEIKSLVEDDEKQSKLTLDAMSLSAARLFRVLEICYRNITENTWCTKRDMYYQDVSLFKSTTTIDRTLQILTRWFDMPREAFHVIGTPKGLVCGDLSYENERKERIALKGFDKGVAVDPLLTIDSNLSTTALFVLLVEDGATFHRLVEYGIHNTLSCIIITGKGYLDFATRNLLMLLSLMDKPILALYDADPHGLEILISLYIGTQVCIFLH